MNKELQPRNRLIKYGVENLSNVDLISIIISTGTKNTSVKEISSNLINSIGSINKLNNMSIKMLTNIKGIGNIKAMKILSSIELGKRVISSDITIRMHFNNSTEVHDAFKRYFIGLKQEKFMLILLDYKNNLISYKILYIGVINSALINPIDIFREAIINFASSIIIIHNHPSGILIPSKKDINTTNKLVSAGKLLDIKVQDHLITNGTNFISIIN